MDSWTNINAGLLLPGVVSQMEDIKNRLQKTQAALGSLNASINLKANAAIDGITLGTSIIDKLNSLNCAVLYLNPSTGDLQTRIATAENTPPFGAYSAGIVIGVTAPTFQDVAAQFETIIDAIKGVSVEKMAIAEIGSAWSWKK